MRKIIVITGQTSTGKTHLAQRMKKELNGELINCDSRQIYRHLDVVTGKDISEIHLYDIVNPKEHFSSFDYVVAALPVIKKILRFGKTPILVGGTYLYIKHLLYGMDTERIPPDWELRSKLQSRTIVELQSHLKRISPDMFGKLNNSDRNNPRRLIRKIEIALYRQKGKNFPTRKTLADTLGIPDLSTEIIGLAFKSRGVLATSIRRRVEKRIKAGAIDEVSKLLALGYTKSDPGLQTIGYQQLIPVVEKKISLEKAVEDWITKEIQYAKRQYTFMKKDETIQWKYI